MSPRFGREEKKRREHTPGPIEHVSLDACPGCGGSLEEITFGQPPLFRHGGYGAMERIVKVVCTRCPWSLTREVSEVRP